MTQTAAICIALLKGDVISIFDGYKRFSCTNLPRELSRSVEKKFGVTLSKDKTFFKSQYEGKPGYYYRYRLNRIRENAEGIQKMTQYCIDQSMSTVARTEKEYKEKQLLKSLQLF